jgi:hypothetical protein
MVMEFGVGFNRTGAAAKAKGCVVGAGAAGWAACAELVRKEAVLTAAVD